MADGYTGTDFYCDVAIPFPDKLDVEYESDRVLAFHHTRPFWQHHVVIVPKRHIASLISVASADEPDIRELLLVVQQLARRADATYGAAAVLTNVGSYQDSKHLHVHVHSGRRVRDNEN